MMGMPAEDEGRIFRPTNILIGSTDPDDNGGDSFHDAFKRAASELYDYAQDLGRERRRSPGDDITTGTTRTSSTSGGGRVPHLTFGGGGPHFCLGAGLARLEIGAMFAEIRARLPDLRVVGQPEMLRSDFLHGVRRMRCTWGGDGRR
jgi:cytochrome P450